MKIMINKKFLCQLVLLLEEKMIYKKLNNILNINNYLYRLFVGIFLILCTLNTKYSHASQLLSSIKLYERGFLHHSRSYSHTNFHNFSESAQLYPREVEGSVR